MTALTIVTATCGRASLADTALSVLDQMAEGDEWLVVGDGPQPAAALYADQWPGVRYLETAPTANYGNSQREMGAQQAANGHVLFVDDDDVLVDGALAIIRQAVAASRAPFTSSATITRIIAASRIRCFGVSRWCAAAMSARAWPLCPPPTCTPPGCGRCRWRMKRTSISSIKPWASLE